MKKLLICFLLIAWGSVVSFAQEIKKELQTEEDGFCWYLLQKTSSPYTTWGAEDVDGNVIIPLDLECNNITYKRSKFFPYFSVSKFYETKQDGIFSIDGHEIIPMSRNYKSIWLSNLNGVEYFCIKKDTLVNKIKNGKVKKEKVLTELEGACDMSGKEIVTPKYHQLIYTVKGFQYAGAYAYNWQPLNIFLDENGMLNIDGYGKTLEKENDGHQWYKIFQDGVYGVMDLEGNEIIPLSRGYSSIYYSSAGYYWGRVNGNTVDCDLTGKVLSNGETLALIKKKENAELAGKSKYNSQTNNSYASNNTSTNATSNTSSNTSNVKALFDQAYNTPDTEAQTKYDRYMQVIKADPYNTYGYKATAYNNLGVLYENLGDLKNAKACYEYALQANPNNEQAKANLKSVKTQRRSQRWDNVIGVLGAIGQAASTMNGSQLGGAYNAYQSTGSSYSGFSGSSTAVGNNTMASTQGNSVTVSDNGNTTRIELSGGGYMLNTKNEDGSVNSQTYQPCIICHGSKTCAVCFGQGGVYNRAYNYWTTCTSCGGRKTCNFCNGTGYSTFVSHTDANGNGYGASNSGYTTTRNAGGVVVTDPNGRSTVHSSGGSGTLERSSSTKSTTTCSKCNGRKYESTSYQYAAASTSGVRQPYHHSGGTGCPYCNYVTDHYHYPCSNCMGTGRQ